MPYKVSIKQYKGIWSYCSAFDKIVQDCIADTVRPQYARALLSYRQQIERELANQSTASASAIRQLQDWYGFPIPSGFADAMDRRTFQNMTLYNNKYEELKDYFQLLEKISTGIIPKDVIKPNDKNLGIFSLERALMSPEKILGLWSVKHKKFFYLGEGDIVLDKNGESKKVKIKIFEDEQDLVLFKLKEDNSDAYLTQIREDITFSSKGLAQSGDAQWGSGNKKSFLYKEKHPRPNNNVRLFVIIGGNANKTELYWAGITAIMTAKFLMTKGYAVRITAVIITSSTYESRNNMQINPNRPFNFNGVKSDGYRVSLMDVKSYEEECDVLGLLYPLADASFFRVRTFDYFMAEQWFYQDDLHGGLYYSPKFQDASAVIEEEIKKRNIVQEKDTLYYFLGGDNVTSLDGAKTNLAYIICDAEKRNAELLSKISGGSQTEFDRNTKVGDIDCDNILQQLNINP